MELEFVARDLRRLDELGGEVVACGGFQDERPFRGLLGLLDWRFAGRLGALAKQAFLTSEGGEVLLVPGRPHVPFEKVLILGLGTRSGFGDGTFRAAVDRLLSAMSGLRARKAVVELPGRGHGAIEPARAAELLLERAASAPDVDAWWLVENDDAERVMRERAKEEARRTRQALAKAEGA